MNKFEKKLKTLLEERETIVEEMGELKQAFEIRQQRLVEIAGSIKTLQELITDADDEENGDENVDTTEK